MPGIRRRREDYSSVGVVYSGKASKEEVAYCPRCLEMANVRSKLGNRIYMPDESGNVTTPPDYDLWRQCHLCGSIYARYEAKQEADITTITEPRDSPFHSRGIILGTDSRKFDRSCKTQHKRRLKKDLSQYKEEDIKEALRKGAKLVSYTER
jgi:hypothetical protein